ncbi:MAG TPA: transcriptional regulator [Brevundimonas sp.]|uniref:cupin-like domain-containing protein n=1 Tax=Brevundimonas sp. TaxID=1871086 RepID=UPI002C8D7ECE|nr:cupin-like domain-containing protein [Brevundimonas sp.]HRH21372.1 transcriptional regulator [Brevundimonas sp.]
MSTRYPGPIIEPRVFDHRIADSGLVSDGALAELLDRYPAELFDINLYDYDNEGQVSLRTGARGRSSGDDLLAAIQTGRLWVNLRGVETAHPALWAEVMKAFEPIKASYPSLRPTTLSGQLILSSPKARVPYHFDPAGVVLFHMRGRKRLWVYPGDEAHLPEQAMEQIVMRQTTEELPYSQAFDADAQVVDLEPGQALTWPLFAPHRVENLSAFCVSLSMDFQTWGSRFRNGALFTHGAMRARGLKPRATDRLSTPGLAARWAAAVALKRTGAVKSRLMDFERSFEPDAGSADGAGTVRG